MIEGEEDCTKESCGLFVRIGLEARMNVDDKGRADGATYEVKLGS